MPPDTSAGLGTLLRHLLELLDGDVEKAYKRLELDFRPRYTPVLKALLQFGSCNIRQIASAAGITHSAASQTVSQMVRCGLLVTQLGNDARERLIQITPLCMDLLPTLETQWAVTSHAASQLNDELSFPLSDLLKEAIAALQNRSFIERIDALNANAEGNPNPMADAPCSKDTASSLGKYQP